MRRPEFLNGIEYTDPDQVFAPNGIMNGDENHNFEPKTGKMVQDSTQDWSNQVFRQDHCPFIIVLASTGPIEERRHHDSAGLLGSPFANGVGFDAIDTDRQVPTMVLESSQWQIYDRRGVKDIFHLVRMQEFPLTT
jgi:hypothetical protein